ncbi:RidA family protein [Pseudomonas sp. TSRC2-2]|uniref:RidA family protein n=2 Tax=unclassified Pseudomonas TaxID=196821 RepID=UPI003CE701B6
MHVLLFAGDSLKKSLTAQIVSHSIGPIKDVYVLNENNKMIWSTTPATAVTWTPLVSRALPAPHFAYSPVVRAGGFVYVSGMVGLDPAHGGLVDGGLAAEVQQILINLSEMCKELTIGLEQLMLVRIYCADFSQFGVLNQHWQAFFEGRTPPARTSLGVAALPLGALVEMEFQFAIDSSLP